MLAAQEQTSGRGRAWPVLGNPAGERVRILSAHQPRAGARGGAAGCRSSPASRSRRGRPGRQAAYDARLKWPNDVLIGDGKLAGILAEGGAAGDAVVIGIGVNVLASPDELPAGARGGLRTHVAAGLGSAGVTREAVLAEILRALGERGYARFRASPDPERCGLLAEYHAPQRHHWPGRPGGAARPAACWPAAAEDVDPGGRLLVRPADAASATPVSAGDVIHLR